ncbi:MAG: hypothetical protein QM775_18835 [Pirellulales bacterium]
MPKWIQPERGQLPATMDAAAQTRRSMRHGRSLGFAALAACLFVGTLSGCKTFQGLHCSHLPKIDPSGQRVFTYDTPYEQRPGPATSHDRTAVMVSPAKIIAPVGTEVVVQAAVCGPDKTLMAGEKVEWSIAPNSVGYFVQAGESGSLDWLHHVGYHTRKIDNTFAVSATSPKFIMLNRGTPESSDDVPVLRGQAWATVSSPVEGTSFVAAVAPDVRNWNSRKQTTTVYWVDCQWTFPPPAINPQGTRHVFTTLLVKHSNKCPLAGYRVRYEIAGGPAAGFAPNGSQIVEVTSNALGQAPVEIFQQSPAAGTNKINIQVIRPADWPGGDGTQLVVGSGTTSMTWTTSVTGLNIDKSGPTEVAVGGTITYRIDIRNPSDLTARGVTVTDAVPAGLMLLGSNPPATVNGNNLSWRSATCPPVRAQRGSELPRHAAGRGEQLRRSAIGRRRTGPRLCGDDRHEPDDRDHDDRSAASGRRRRRDVHHDGDQPGREHGQRTGDGRSVRRRPEARIRGEPDRESRTRQLATGRIAQGERATPRRARRPLVQHDGTLGRRRHSRLGSVVPHRRGFDRSRHSAHRSHSAGFDAAGRRPVAAARRAKDFERLAGGRR